jgi:sulfur-oxidizing protein SoxZ
MAVAKALIRVPAQATRGEVIEIKVLISHPMESGLRRDDMGRPIPRDIINRFVCTYNGEEVFRADLFPAISANPFLSFFTIATATGELVFRWTDDQGTTHSQTASITVV